MTSRSTPVATSPTTTSAPALAAGHEQLGEQGEGVGQEAGDVLGEGGGQVAVDQAVVDGERPGQGRAGADLAVDDERAGPDGAEAHDPGLRRPDQRGGEPAAEGAVVRDREGSAPKVCDADRPVPSRPGEAADLGAEI